MNRIILEIVQAKAKRLTKETGRLHLSGCSTDEDTIRGHFITNTDIVVGVPPIVQRSTELLSGIIGDCVQWFLRS